MFSIFMLPSQFCTSVTVRLAQKLIPQTDIVVPNKILAIIADCSYATKL